MKAGGHVVEIAELGVAVGMLAALGDLGVGLQRVAEAVQQAQHRARRHLEALAHQILGQVRRGLRRPTQQRHRVAPRLGMHQLVERLEQTGLLVDQRLVATARRPQTSRRLDPGRHFRLGLDHRVAAHPRRRGHRRLAAPTQHLRRRPATTRRCTSFMCGRTTSKNRASASGVTSTPPRYYARTILAWTLKGPGGQVLAIQVEIKSNRVLALVSWSA